MNFSNKGEVKMALSLLVGKIIHIIYLASALVSIPAAIANSLLFGYLEPTNNALFYLQITFITMSIIWATCALLFPKMVRRISMKYHGDRTIKELFSLHLISISLGESIIAYSMILSFLGSQLFITLPMSIIGCLCLLYLFPFKKYIAISKDEAGVD
jgi:hypothetical protein